MEAGAAADERSVAAAAPPAVGIDAVLRFLASPAAYPEATASVERVETHFSWVFLTDRHVYKLKKRMHANGVDFTALAARRRNAEAECRLNRRLAADVYLGKVPLTWESVHGLAIGGAGAVVDWLVKMRRLPADHMLDQRLRHADWRYADFQALADRLAGFFATAPRVTLSPPAYLARLRGECRGTRRAFDAAGIPALRDQARRAAAFLEAYIARRRKLLLRPLGERRIVEGHGDLRPEHVWLGSTPRIFDCLEFRRELRLLDPAEEIAFLAMECARLGVRDIEPILFRRYRRRAKEAPAPELIAFYKALNALIRARIAILHLREVPVREPAKWPARAAEYLGIAARQCRYLAR